MNFRHLLICDTIVHSNVNEICFWHEITKLKFIIDIRTNLINSFGTRIGYLNDPLCDEYDPTYGLGFPRGHFTFSEKQSINYKMLIFLSST